MYDFETVHPRIGRGSEKWDTVQQWDDELIVPLSVADMEFRTAPEIIEAVRGMADFGLWGYTHDEDRFRQSVKNWMQARHGWEIETEWIATAPGVVPALYTAVRAFTSPGDQIIIQPPVYPPFFMAGEGNDRKIVENALIYEEGRYRMDFEDLESKAPHAKMLILCSPHNPVGRVWTKEELQRLAEICQRHDLLVLSDEIHCDIVLSGYRHVPYGTIEEALRGRCIVATSASKSFSLAGLSCSSIVIEDEAMRKAFKKRQYIDGTFFNSTFGWVATRAAYDHAAPWLDAMIEEVEKNHAILSEFFNNNLPACRVHPLEGTYLAWVDCHALGFSDSQLDCFLKNKAGLYCNPGISFGAGGAGHIRVNLACPASVLEAALKRLLKALENK